MADDSKPGFSSIKIKSEDNLTVDNEDNVGSESSDENVPLKKQKLSNGESKFIFKQEPCASDNNINGNGADDVDNATEENDSEEELNSSSEKSEIVENETSLNRMLRKILNEKKKELLTHPDIIKLFTPK